MHSTFTASPDGSRLDRCVHLIIVSGNFTSKLIKIIENHFSTCNGNLYMLLMNLVLLNLKLSPTVIGFGCSYQIHLGVE